MSVIEDFRKVYTMSAKLASEYCANNWYISDFLSFVNVKPGVSEDSGNYFSF